MQLTAEIVLVLRAV